MMIPPVVLELELDGQNDWPRVGSVVRWTPASLQWMTFELDGLEASTEVLSSAANFKAGVRS